LWHVLAPGMFDPGPNDITFFETLRFFRHSHIITY
jgi:hypothetical protein